MRTSVFATLCAVSVEAASLKSFPSFDIQQNEFAQTLDDEAFYSFLSEFSAERDNLPISTDDFFLQTLSEADATTYSEVLAGIKANADALSSSNTEVDAVFVGKLMNYVGGLADDVVDGVKEMTDGNIVKGFETMAGSDYERTMKNNRNSRAVVNSADRNVARVGSNIEEASLMMIAKTLELGGDAFDEMIRTAKKAKDYVTE